MAKNETFQGITPPTVSARAFEESKEQVRGYHEKFQDESTPPEFRGKFIDVGLAAKVLAESKRHLWCELVVYVILVTLYCVYLLVLVYIADSNITMTHQNQVVSQPFQYNKFYFEYSTAGPNESDTTWCHLPFEEGASNANTTNVSDPKAPCRSFSNTLTYSTINTKDEYVTWLKLAMDDLVEMMDLHSLATKQDNTFYSVGAVRLRQIRVKKALCIADLDSNQICTMPYSRENEDKSDFTGLNGTVYTYSSASDLALSTVNVSGQDVTLDATDISNSNSQSSGRLYNYGMGGFVQDIPLNLNGQAQFDALLSDNWIDSQTAALLVSLTLYSVDLDVFIFEEYLGEFTNYGVVTTLATSDPFVLTESAAAEGFEITILILCSVLLMVLLVGFAFDLRTASFKEAFIGWRMYDMCNLCLIIATVALRTQAASQIKNLPDKDNVSLDEVISALMQNSMNVYTGIFRQIADVHLLTVTLSAISLIICFLKSFKYVRLDRRFSVAVTSVYYTRYRLAGWFVLILFAVFGFSFFCTIAYGFFVYEYASFGYTFTNIVLCVLQVGSQAFPFHVVTQAENDYGKRMWTLLNLNQEDLQLSNAFFSVSDFSTNIFLVSSLVFVVAFVLVVTIVLTNMFQSIIIFGFRGVSQKVFDEENLRLERRETYRTVSRKKVGWFKNQVRLLSSMMRWTEKRKIVSKFSTTAQHRFRNHFSFSELRAMIADVIKSPHRVEEVSRELMALFQTEVSRIDDAAVLFQDIKIAIREGKQTFQIKDEDLPLIKPSAEFDPTHKERWLRDMQTGELIISLLFVHSLQLESTANNFDSRIRDIDALQRRIQDQALEIIAAIADLENKNGDRNGDIFAPADPWQPRIESCVEKRPDGRYDAHHVNADDNVHRYLGIYKTAYQAQYAIDQMNIKFEKQNQQQATKENKNVTSKIIDAARVTVLGETDELSDRDSEYEDDDVSSYNSKSEDDRSEI
mmetsp:Transcript_11035/g.20447  ORF Transcript_11035/g.20447 Transcript_11035/m.20447 type:complete len:972 (-) Transcript_11035:188-3103(-)